MFSVAPVAPRLWWHDIYHADYPMKFGEAHKYMNFRMYKVLQEENIPVDEEVTQAKLMKDLLIPSL